MKFEDAVVYQMRCWPSIMPHRAAVLDSLFLHFGSGTIWHEGVIRNHYEDDNDPGKGREKLAEMERKLEERLAETRADYADCPELLERTLESQREFWEPHIESVRRILDNPAGMARGEHCVVMNGFYPLGKHGGAPLQCIPDDVRPDWLAGAREMCALILACPLEGTQEGSAKRNKRFAKRILEELDERFGAPESEPDISYVTWEGPTPAEHKELKAKTKAAVLAALEEVKGN